MFLLTQCLAAIYSESIKTVILCVLSLRWQLLLIDVMFVNVNALGHYLS